MSKMLFDEQPLVIDRVLARKIGLNESIVLQQVHYWIGNIKRNKSKHKDNFQDGEYWTYNSIAKWQEENFDFWSYDTVKRTFKKLEDMGILITGTYNKEKRDQTKWYRINYELLNELTKDESEKKESKEEKNTSQPLCTTNSAKCTNALGQNAPMQKGKMHQPLPETSSEISSEKESQSVSPDKDNINYENKDLKKEKQKTDGRTDKPTQIIEEVKKIYGEDIVNRVLKEKMDKCKATGGKPYRNFLTKCCEELKDLKNISVNKTNQKKFTHEHSTEELEQAIRRKTLKSYGEYDENVS